MASNRSPFFALEAVNTDASDGDNGAVPMETEPCATPRSAVSAASSGSQQLPPSKAEPEVRPRPIRWAELSDTDSEFSLRGPKTTAVPSLLPKPDVPPVRGAGSVLKENDSTVPRDSWRYRDPDELEKLSRSRRDSGAPSRRRSRNEFAEAGARGVNELQNRPRRSRNEFVEDSSRGVKELQNKSRSRRNSGGKNNDHTKVPGTDLQNNNPADKGQPNPIPEPNLKPVVKKAWARVEVDAIDLRAQLKRDDEQKRQDVLKPKNVAGPAGPAKAEDLQQVTRKGVPQKTTQASLLEFANKGKKDKKTFNINDPAPSAIPDAQQAAIQKDFIEETPPKSKTEEERPSSYAHAARRALEKMEAALQQEQEAVPKMEDHIEAEKAENENNVLNSNSTGIENSEFVFNAFAQPFFPAASFGELIDEEAFYEEMKIFFTGNGEYNEASLLEESDQQNNGNDEDTKDAQEGVVWTRQAILDAILAAQYQAKCRVFKLWEPVWFPKPQESMTKRVKPVKKTSPGKDAAWSTKNQRAAVHKGKGGANKGKGGAESRRRAAAQGKHKDGHAETKPRHGKPQPTELSLAIFMPTALVPTKEPLGNRGNNKKSKKKQEEWPALSNNMEKENVNPDVLEAAAATPKRKSKKNRKKQDASTEGGEKKSAKPKRRRRKNAAAEVKPSPEFFERKPKKSSRKKHKHKNKTQSQQAEDGGHEEVQPKKKKQKAKDLDVAKDLDPTDSTSTVPRRKKLTMDDFRKTEQDYLDREAKRREQMAMLKSKPLYIEYLEKKMETDFPAVDTPNHKDRDISTRQWKIACGEWKQGLRKVLGIPEPCDGPGPEAGSA